MRDHLTFANVTATVALIVALGLGSAYAADKIGSKDIAKNAIVSKHVKAKSVKRSDLANNAVNSRKVADGSLSGEDFGLGQLPEGPPGEDATNLFAFVGEDGTLINGEGVTEAVQTGQGSYLVNFERTLENCIALAGAGVNNSTEGPAPGFTSAASRANAFVVEGTGVDVATFDSAGFQEDNAFMLAIFCP